MVKDTICKVIDILHIPDLILELNIFVPKSSYCRHSGVSVWVG